MVINQILHRLFTLIVMVFLVGCKNEEIRNLPVTESENLNKLLSNAPINWINLNQSEIDTIIIRSEHIYEESLFVDESLYVANPIQVTAFNSYLVTVEFSSGNVVAIDRNGNPAKKIGRSGRGPGEFERPIAVMNDGSRLYIYDDGLKRISVFDKDFLLVDTFDFTEGVAYENKMKMNNSYLIYQNNNASGFHATIPEGHLMTVRSIAEFNSIYFEAMPRIVPSGMHPGAYNNILISINYHDEILTAFSGLPYLFLYKDFHHEKTIALEAVHFDTIGNPSLRPYPPVDNTGVRVSGIVNHIFLKDNGDIFIMSFRLLHHLKANQDGDYYTHRSYYLKREDTGEQIMTIRDMDIFPDDPERIYAIGWGFLFDFILPE
jgi:hypothetical protein